MDLFTRHPRLSAILLALFFATFPAMADEIDTWQIKANGKTFTDVKAEREQLAKVSIEIGEKQISLSMGKPSALHVFEMMSKVTLQVGQTLTYRIDQYLSPNPEEGKPQARKIYLGIEGSDGKCFGLNIANQGEMAIVMTYPRVFRTVKALPDYKAPAVFSIMRTQTVLTFYLNGETVYHRGIAEDLVITPVINGVTKDVHTNVSTQIGYELVQTPQESLPSAVTMPPPPDPAHMPKMQIGLGMLPFGPESGFFQRGDLRPSRLDKGYYENAPLVQSQDGLSTQAVKFRDLYKSGLRAWSAGWNKGNSIRALWSFAEAARESGTGMLVFPTIGGSYRQDGENFLRDYWLEEDLRNHPNVWKIDGCPVVMCWPYTQAQVWQKRIDRAAEVGGRFFIINEVGSPDMLIRGMPLPDTYRSGAQAADAIYYFSSSSMGIRDGKHGALPAFKQFAQSLDKKVAFGGTVRPGYIGTCRVGAMLNPRGTLIHRKQWLEIIEQNPDFVHITTPEDYSEATEQDVSGNSSFTFIDINRYFGERWQTGQWPADQMNQAFVSYRKNHVVNEPFEVEVVLLRPDITGKESVDELNQRLTLAFDFRLNQSTQSQSVSPDKIEVYPGHVAWRFWITQGIDRSGFIMPHVTLRDNGQTIWDKDAAPAVIIDNGESVIRKWLRVPLHRLRNLDKATMVVDANFGKLYPRRITMQNLPWDDVLCALYERAGNPLHTSIDKQTLMQGYMEAYDGDSRGWTPMAFGSMWSKRRIADSVDRYTSVVRFTDDTIAYLPPVTVDAPTLEFAQTVDDYVFSPGEKVLYDRGPLQRDIHLSENAQALMPDILQDQPGQPWYAHFSGKQEINLGQLACPPGPMTVELWCRISEIGKVMPIYGSWPPVLNVYVDQAGKLRVLRLDRGHYARQLTSDVTLNAGQWYHIVATWDSRLIRLYVNGQASGQPVEALGVRSVEYACLGKAGWYPNIINSSPVLNLFEGDIARYRTLQMALDDDVIGQIYRRDKVYFSIAGSSK